MFAIRFVRSDRDYKSYSVVSYEVGRQSNGGASVEMSRKLNGQDSFTEYVDGDGYEIAYITNLDGKTIDVVRQVETKGHDSEPTD